MPIAAGKCSYRLLDSRWPPLKGKMLENPQRLSVCLWSVIEGCWKAAGKCHNNSYQRVGEKGDLPSSYGQKRGNFNPYSLKHCVSLTLIKSRSSCGKLKNAQQFFSYFTICTLSNHTTFSQTQSGATVPLRTLTFIYVTKQLN